MRNVTELNVSAAVEDLLEEVTTLSAGELAWRLTLAFLLLCMSGLFSGLTLGLLALDVAALRVIIEADKDSVASKRAAIIFPLRQDGNLLLCTLLFGNVGVNAALTLVLADLTTGTTGFIISTAVITIFGEIIPQATCARYALAIGSKVVWLVRIFIVLLFIVAKPIALVLDKVLGDEIGEVHNKKELLEVVKFHQQTNVLDESQARVIEGALRFDDKTVRDVMTPLDKVFMLEADDLLDYDTIANIYRAGHSRIPVHKTNSRGNVIGVLFTRDLILLDPDDCTPVKNAVTFFERTLHNVQSSDKLSVVMGTFKTGSTHIAKVNAINNKNPDKDPFFELVGIVTMEDIIEEIIGDEIIDETDNNKVESGVSAIVTVFFF
jgi:metal transporter CNNM